MKNSSIVEKLTILFCELIGMEAQEVDPETSLFDLGFDSLTLTQTSGLLKKNFDVKISFRDLIENYTTIAEIAAYISSQYPPESAAPDEPPPPQETAAHPAAGTEIAEDMVRAERPALPADHGIDAPLSFGSATFSEVGFGGSETLARIMNAQLQVMKQQLAMLGPAAVSRPSPVGTEAKASRSEPSSAAAADSESRPREESGKPEDSVQHGPFRPQAAKQAAEMGAVQKSHLTALIDRFVSRTIKSKEYTQKHRQHFADPRAVSGFKQEWKELVYPIVATRSAGAYLWDVDGNRWVDVTLGFGVNLLGHSPPFITEALKNQLDSGVEIGPQNPYAGEVAELIAEFTGLERVAFCNTGSEAVMAAIRLCRTVTGRERIVFFAGDYHGTFDEVLARGVGSGETPKTLPLAPGVAPNLVSQVTVLEYGTERSLRWIKQHAGELAAVLVEPVQSRNPGLQPKEFLQEVRRITEQKETPLIFDEVITGFRCHPGGAQAHFGVRADLATYGKVIGGGMPIGVIAGTRQYMDALDGGFWRFGDDSFPPSGVTFFAGTFVRHPLAMAAAKTMLLHLQQEGPALQANLADRTERMLGRINDFFQEEELPLKLDRFTSVWYPHFDSNVKYSSLLYYFLRDKGLHIWEGRPCFLSTAHTAEDEAFIESAFRESAKEMQDGGFFPAPD